jgi:hypothetical protein
MTGDKNGRSTRKNSKGGSKCTFRPPSNANSARYDFHPFGVGNERPELDEGRYGGVFRTLRFHPMYSKGKV